MTEFLAAVLITWPLHMVVALIFAVPTFFLTRTKARWSAIDVLGFILPWLVWFLAFVFGPRAASLSSAILESLLLGLLVGFAYVVFAFLQTRMKVRHLRAEILGAVCVFEILVWAIFPFIGE